MQDFKHLYNKEPKPSTWEVIRDFLAFAGFIVMALVFFLVLASV